LHSYKKVVERNFPRRSLFVVFIHNKKLFGPISPLRIEKVKIKSGQTKNNI
jgi:hypothetical protein